MMGILAWWQWLYLAIGLLFACFSVGYSVTALGHSIKKNLIWFIPTVLFWPLLIALAIGVIWGERDKATKKAERIG
jgi:hypothetical protein